MAESLLGDNEEREKYIKYLGRVTAVVCEEYSIPKTYSSIDDQIRDYRQNMESAGAGFPLFDELRRGRIRLECLVEDYEKQFYKVLESKKREDELEVEIKEYTQQIQDLIYFFNRLSGTEIRCRDISSYENIGKFNEKLKSEEKSGKIGNGMFLGGGMLTVISSICFPQAFFPLFAVTLVGMFMGQDLCDSRSRSLSKLNKIYHQFNSLLKENARYVDRFVERIYIQDFFLSNRKRFKQVYPKLSAHHQKYIDQKLEDMLGLGLIDMNELELTDFLENCREKP